MLLVAYKVLESIAQLELLDAQHYILTVKLFVYVKALHEPIQGLRTLIGCQLLKNTFHHFRRKRKVGCAEGQISF